MQGRTILTIIHHDGNHCSLINYHIFYQVLKIQKYFYLISITLLYICHMNIYVHCHIKIIGTIPQVFINLIKQ
jgi:hypothetical protein